ncbi:FecR family protein [Flavitalea sp. BT771]|uniref:FecR family protein n=1 Tax=Flavitalea sp. BT771 TaxID=3063329 RepID=UPI0026E43731|nr:FecR family protein [Flavitalea sp. BT771]MDO6433033.1 FecR family protein [Flavitalea sp. BT771]MDV6221691.1 FecR family protein [Flavitalea sp. BT771]
MAEEERIAELILKQLRHNLSVEEKVELDAWTYASDANRQYMAHGASREHVLSAMKALLTRNDKAIDKKLKKLRRKIRKSAEAPVLHAWSWYAGRVAIFVLLTGMVAVTFFYFHRDRAPAVSKTHIARQDLDSGRITLTLLDGTTLYMDEMPTGSNIEGKGWRIIKVDSQHIAYSDVHVSPANGAGEDVPYHLLSTPYGQGFYVSLPDRSEIQLGAGTSIKYAVRSAGGTKGERAVMLNGEAYFTVAKNKDVPFIVSTQKAKVTVLSTDFCVHDYPGESGYLATVVSGAIDVSDGKTSVHVVAGEAAKMDSSSAGIRVSKYDAMKGLAWRSNFFDFAHLNLRQSLMQIGDWYGKGEIVIHPGVDTVNLGVLSTGLISKNVKLDTLLKKIGEARHLHLRAEGNKIIAGP